MCMPLGKDFLFCFTWTLGNNCALKVGKLLYWCCPSSNKHISNKVLMEVFYFADYNMSIGLFSKLLIYMIKINIW